MIDASARKRGTGCEYTTFVLRIETNSGVTGIGEADSSPAVVDAIVNAPISHDKSAGLKEVLLGRDPFNVEVLWNEMFDRSYF